MNAVFNPIKKHIKVMVDPNSTLEQRKEAWAAIEKRAKEADNGNV